MDKALDIAKAAEAAERTIRELQKEFTNVTSLEGQVSTNHLKYQRKKNHQVHGRQKKRQDQNPSVKSKQGPLEKLQPCVHYGAQDHKPPDCVHQLEVLQLHQSRALGKLLLVKSRQAKATHDSSERGGACSQSTRVLPAFATSNFSFKPNHCEVYGQ